MYVEIEDKVLASLWVNGKLGGDIPIAMLWSVEGRGVIVKNKRGVEVFCDLWIRQQTMEVSGPEMEFRMLSKPSRRVKFIVT